MEVPWLTCVPFAYQVCVVKLGHGAHTCNPSVRAEAGVSGMQHHPGPHSKLEISPGYLVSPVSK